PGSPPWRSIRAPAGFPRKLVVPERAGRRAVALAALAVLALRPLSARGEGGEAGGDVARAEALFQQGKRSLEKGDSAAACPKLAESLRLDKATGTLLALAMCHESEGRLASAWAEYAEVVARAAAEGRTDREQAARRSVRALEPKLSTLTIEVPAEAAAVDGLRVERDGLSLAAPAWSTAVPVDPGRHVVTASAPGRRTWSISVQIGALAEGMRVAVPVLAPQAPATPPDGPEPVLAASVGEGGSPGAGWAAARAPAPLTVALLAGVAAGSTSPAFAVEAAAGRRWGGALRAGAFRRFRSGRAVALAAGPEVLFELDREQATGLGGLPSASRVAWGLGLQGAADVRVASWVSLSVVVSADYAPSDWAGTFEVSNRGEVLRPAPFRVLVGAGPRFTFDW